MTGLHINAKKIASRLESHGFNIVNKVVYNQILVTCNTEEETTDCLHNLQRSGTIWLGGSSWHDQKVIRISVCSWYTDDQDIDKTVEAFIQARNQ